jgi:hypothetical protein
MGTKLGFQPNAMKTFRIENSLTLELEKFKIRPNLVGSGLTLYPQKEIII